jgi:predicted PolB exonuclease-like 3'-5' exonuclease
MDNITSVVALISEVIGLIILLVTYYKKNKKQMDKIADGTKCQLRSEMLRSYYHNREEKKIRQYEYENFVKLYDSYKCLGGNSFIDKIYEEIKEWEIIS